MHQLTCQTFNLLIKRLKQLDCQIIYANFHKLIIWTNKRSQQEAEDHVAFSINTIKRDHLFKKLSLEIGNSYALVLFKDIANYAGINEDAQDMFMCKMDLIGHLPEAVRGIFKNLVKEFVVRVWVHNRELAKNMTEVDEDAMIAAELLGESLENKTNEGNFGPKAKDHEFICELITKKFSHKLF